MWVHWEIKFLKGVHEKSIYGRGDCLNEGGGGLGQFADLRRTWENGVGVEGGFIPQSTLWVR